MEAHIDEGKGHSYEGRSVGSWLFVFLLASLGILPSSGKKIKKEDTLQALPQVSDFPGNLILTFKIYGEFGSVKFYHTRIVEKQ